MADRRDKQAPERNEELALLRARVAELEQCLRDQPLTEQALRSSEARLAGIIASAMDGIITIDADQRIMGFNSAAERLFGLTADEALGRPVERLMPESCREAHRGHVAHFAADNNEPRRMGDTHTISGLRSSGEEFPIEASISMVQLGDQRFYTAVVRDITERRAAEERLREIEAKFSAVVEQPFVGVLVLDDAQIVEVNRSLSDLLGYKFEEFLGHRFTEFLTPKSAALALEQSFKQAPKPFEVWARRRDGALVPLEVTGADFPYEGRSRRIAVVRDLTEHKQHEAEAAHQQEQLLRADKLASLSMLAAGIAHDINNPNHSFILSASLLGKIWEDAIRVLDHYWKENGDYRLGGLDYQSVRTEVPELIADMHDCSIRIKNVVEELRDYATRRAPDLIEPVDLNAVLQSAMTLASSVLRKSTRHLTIDYGAGLPVVSADFQALEHALINVLLTACEALPDYDHAIRVSTHYDRTDQSVVLTVTDDGEGRSDTVVQGLTDPFCSPPHDDSDIGIELAISAAIVRSHRGVLTLQSSPGKGTTVTIRLPVTEIPEEEF